jgi:hypothetical protein
VCNDRQHFPETPVFDGINIWVPNYADSSISVIQASSGNVSCALMC